jgi:hypothetical protein
VQSATNPFDGKLKYHNDTLQEEAIISSENGPSSPIGYINGYKSSDPLTSWAGANESYDPSGDSPTNLDSFFDTQNSTTTISSRSSLGPDADIATTTTATSVEKKQSKAKAKRQKKQSSEAKKTNKSKLPIEHRNGLAARVVSDDDSDTRWIRVVYLSMIGIILAAGTDIKALLSGLPYDTRVERKKASANTKRLMDIVGDRHKHLLDIGSRQIMITKDWLDPWWLGGFGNIVNDGGKGQSATCIDYYGLLDIIKSEEEKNAKKSKKRKDTTNSCIWLRTNLLPVLAREHA